LKVKEIISERLKAAGAEGLGLSRSAADDGCSCLIGKDFIFCPDGSVGMECAAAKLHKFDLNSQACQECAELDGHKESEFLDASGKRVGCPLSECMRSAKEWQELNVCNMLAEHLGKVSAAGLWRLVDDESCETCGCGIDGLVPCGELQPDCEPAKRHTFDARSDICEICDLYVDEGVSGYCDGCGRCYIPLED